MPPNWACTARGPLPPSRNSVTVCTSHAHTHSPTFPPPASLSLSDGLLVAVEAGPALWDWLCAIRWRGSLPVPADLPYLSCMVTSDRHELYQDPLALQNKLLEVMSYRDYRLPAVVDKVPDAAADGDEDAAAPEANSSNETDSERDSDDPLNSDDPLDYSDSDDDYDDYHRRDSGTGNGLDEAQLGSILASMYSSALTPSVDPLG